MLDRLLKEKLSRLEVELQNNDYRIESITITIDDNFVHVKTQLKIDDKYIESVLRIKDMIDSFVYDNEYDNEIVYSNIRIIILNIIECEYRKQLLEVLHGK